MSKKRRLRCQAAKLKTPHRHSNVQICFSNIRGLRSNFDEVSHFLQGKSPDIFAVSETRLDSSVPSSEFTPDGYTLHRVDKAPSHGLALFAKTSLPLRRLTEFEDSRHEYLTFIAPFRGITFILFFLYRSPSTDCEVINVISDKLDCLLQRYPSAEVAVFGDFNVHHVDWLVHSRTTDVSGQAAYDFALSHNLSQIVSSPTRVPDRVGDSGYLLDLFLTTNPDYFSHKVSPPLGTSDHCVVTVTGKHISSTPSVPFHRTVYRFSKADWCGFRNFLSQVAVNVIGCNDVHTAAQELSEWLQIGMKAYIPHRTYQMKPHSQPWFSPECAAAICQRDHFFHQYKRNNSADNLEVYRAARRHCKETLHQAKSSYASYVRDSITNQKLGSKDFWRIYSSITKKYKSSIPALSIDDSNLHMATTSAEKAELLCKEFAKNSSLDDGGQNPPPFPPRTTETLLPLKITVRLVKKVIKSLDSSKSSGPDGIPVIVFKQLCPELAPILTILFRKSVSVGEFPSCWKSASVVPVPKKDSDSSKPSSYRPISLLPIAGKIFEALINSRLLDFIESNHLLSDAQYGFQHSCCTGDLLSYDSIVSKLVMYADDTTLFNSIERSKGSTQRRQLLNDALNKDLQAISEWGSKWQVSFNPSKTQSILHSRLKEDGVQYNIQITDNRVQQCNTISLLGLTISNDLSWKSYIQSVSKQAAQRIGSLYRACRYLPPQTVLYLYKATIRPLMEYCCHLWAGAPKSHLSLLDRVEKRAKNLVGEALANQLQPLKVRRDVASLSLFYRYYFGRCSSALERCVPKPKVFHRSTRRANTLACYHVSQERSRTEGRSRSFFVRTARLWNQLPVSCFPEQYNIGSFKRRVNRFLMEANM